MGYNIVHLRVHFLVDQTSPDGLLNDRVRHGMGEMFLQTGCNPKHLILVPLLEGHDAGHHRPGLRESTGLIEYDGIRLRHGLQIDTALDCNQIASRLPHG